ncbi:MAG: hypothetical protein COW01_03430 [Bdellovibrionales bacterium CG12_big_fil_rev_8_21_14_0_65_38_15]|nr:MAG: hypothetical protein COW79_01990 [Bdellovibrionales bacterium CG22_combo_CG10-13_8_21_14_all_38_13]PIQ56896.1 MAG: hypothetical protein COW01_03430 [Bdellovibrionales bacterium CG12_big_fil_rev_8_21_14_0_65_38_15]PIR30061.1 MAG: hypothetical protein COV38_07150 [Bdellovibrionales bacterium CG11_big_fil_rev_8_21_14_0_20_38_13]
MMDKDKFDDIIIGAGYAGLSLAALLTKRSRKVLVLEAHSLVGGCASYYNRQQFHFDVGATTLSGLAEGMPLKILINKLNLKSDYKKLDLPMKIKLPNGIILNRFADFDLWINELDQKFPNIDHRTFWNKLEKISTRAWGLLADTWSFPPQNLSEVLNLLKPSLLKEADLGLYLLQPLKSILPNEYKQGALKSFIDEQLMISTQTTSEDVPILMGALGLTYPNDMYYPNGGISSLALSLKNFICENGGEVLLKSRVESISDDLVVSTKDHQYKSDHVISTLPIWNLKELNPKLSDWVNSQASAKGEYWSAITANLAVKFKTPKTDLYHQLHLKEPLSAAKSHSLFISLSDPSDLTRAPEGWQTMTISTHALPSDFPTQRNEVYKELKKQILIEIKNHLSEYFDDIEETKFDTIGTPLTFVKYTSRFQGRVGGIPHSVNFMPWKWPKNVTPLTNFFHHGDTSFPGQGIVGVVQGSLNFMKRYHGEK